MLHCTLRLLKYTHWQGHCVSRSRKPDEGHRAALSGWPVEFWLHTEPEWNSSKFCVDEEGRQRLRVLKLPEGTKLRINGERAASRPPHHRLDGGKKGDRSPEDI